MADKGIINLRFNQDQGCFTCCMESGLMIFNVDPLAYKTSYDLETMGSLSQCEMLHRTNILALVSGGSRPKFANHSVLLYDDSKALVFAVLLFKAPVLAVRLRRDKVVVATATSIHLFSFPDKIERLFSLETRYNPLGLVEVTPMLTAERHLLVYPGHKSGSVQLVDLSNTEAGITSAPVTINSHKNDLACLAINLQGTLIATASAKGTLIRVWDTVKKRLHVELRRGSDPAKVYCINFSRDSEFLCCSSDNGTIHIFALKDTHLNKRSSFSSIRLFGTYVESQWALANFTVPPECACVCAFGSRSSVVAICVDGTYHKYVFNTDGNCNRECFDIFLEMTPDDDFVI